MKKLNLLIVTLILFSFQKPTEELHGFGGFNIDSDFASNRKAAEFKKTMPGEYYCKSIELSSDIGKVADINITTDNGKIIDVKFSSNTDTNISSIQKQLQHLSKNGKSSKFENEIAVFNSYSSNSEDIVFVDIEYKKKILKNGKHKHEFRYSNKKAIKENDKLIKSMATSNR